MSPLQTWKKCQVTQGKAKTLVEVANGAARYEAFPGEEVITLDAAD